MNSAVPSARPVDVTQLRRPTTERYRALISALMSIDQEHLSGADPLRSAIAALSATCLFIGEDQILRTAGVSVTLRRLLAALNDTAAGAKPAMLFCSDTEKQKKAGRRTNLTDHILRGALVHALSELITAKMSRKDAARFLEKKLEIAKARYQGKPIAAGQLLQWREQRADSAPTASDEAAREVDRIRGQFSQLLPTLKNAKVCAEGIAFIVARYNSK